MTENIIGTLTIQEGPGKGKQFSITADKSLTIGRSEDCDVQIPDKTVSRKHGELVVKEDSVHFINHGVNGSIINGNKIQDNRPRPLSAETIITIGPCTLRYNPVLTEKTVEVSRTAISTLPESTKEPQAGQQPEEPVQEEKPKTEKSEAALLKSPVSKAVVAILIVFGLLFILVPKEKKDQKTQTTSKQQQQKKTISKDSLAVLVTIPEVTIQGPVPETEKQKALSLFKVAEKQFSEQKLRHRNTFDSIQKWEQGIGLIGKYSERPEDFDSAVQNCRTAKKLLHEKFNNLAKNVRIAYRQKDYRRAYDDIQIILASIPDRVDYRYKWAKQTELLIKPKLKKNRR
jgi:pSer/pThr/pTyr-binding forkhead associated (FHA) protein